MQEKVKEHVSLTNSNRWETRQLVTMALFTALGVILSFIEFPLLPGISWLKYDASAVPALIGGFAYGPVAGCIVGVLGAIIHGVFLGDLWGTIINIAAVIAFVLPASLVYKRFKSLPGIIVGLIMSTLLMIAVCILMNLLITPFYLGVPLDAVIAMILPILLPFNAIKAVLNSIISALIFKSIATLLEGNKKK